MRVCGDFKGKNSRMHIGERLEGRYFEGLKVMDAGEEVLREMGQYPVISLTW